jgi:diguanylate cyclase (GGDEF)-like protein
VSLRLWGSIILATIPVLVWSTLVEPNYRNRLLVVLLVWGSMVLAHARLIWQHGGRTFSYRFTLVVLLVQAGVLLLRFVAALVLPSGDGLFSISPIQTLYVMSNAFVTTTLCMGLILMATDRLRAELEHLATHDGQTGVWSRVALIDTCEQELARCLRHGRSMALLMMDLDRFKAINDQHGHLMGDRVIRDFVDHVLALLRRPDQLGRFGGEEFIVLLPETSLEEAEHVAQRICSEVAKPSGLLPAYTVSIGVAANRPDDAQIDALLARADKALYKAKDAGRNCVAVA